MKEYYPLAETENFIVLDHYEKIVQPNTDYQTEADLEGELIEDLVNQGYEFIKLKDKKEMLQNIKTCLEKLNNVTFLHEEWDRFCQNYLHKSNENQIDKTKKVHHDFIKDFVFDDGHIENIALFDKQHLSKNKVQVMSQFEQTGSCCNRYDVTVLVNGLPMVQIELKKRGVAIREAFHQIHRYQKESFNDSKSLYQYVQIFVISNGTDSRYFANTTKRDQNSFDFTMNWAKSDNTPIKDLKDFTATFLEKQTLLKVLLYYSVFDNNNNLLIMRPYQIAATERILWKINGSYGSNIWSKTEGFGYIWHTTGSGKTLTSFKAARLATSLPFIDKVFFVVDRKDLDHQTMKEYQAFCPDSVNGSESTKELKENIKKNDNKIIVTTIQKLNNLIKVEEPLPIYKKQVVFIFDECHRSQFGKAQKNIKAKFKQYYQFGFTGTPIFTENALGSETTASVFGRELHSYVITDAIRDEKVLKFKVDYNNVRPKFRSVEQEQDEQKISAYEHNKALLHPERIKQISQYILDHFNQKTHRSIFVKAGKGFNAMFAVSSVDAAKLYYESFQTLQQGKKHPLKIATIFSFVQNEEQSASGSIQDETFDPSALNMTAKEFLQQVIDDYNAMFQTNYSVDSKDFQNYYRDLSERVKKNEVDLLIVVGMFLTGFDAKTLNTLFIDKNLKYHGLIQAYSRTNRIYNATKTFGNIVTFRDLEQATIDAIRLFGDTNKRNVVLEKSYAEYMNGFQDTLTNESKAGYIHIVNKLNEKFTDVDTIKTESQQKEFVELFGKYLNAKNILRNYDEFYLLDQFQSIDQNNQAEIEQFQKTHFLNDETMEQMKSIPILTKRMLQDYTSTYHDIKENIARKKEDPTKGESIIDWDDVVFEIDLLKSQEINLEYILSLILEKNKKIENKEELISEAKRLIRSSVGNRAKEGLLVSFLEQTDLNQIPDAPSIIESFFHFAKKQQQKESNTLIEKENLIEEKAKRYLEISLKRQYVSENGTDLNDILPKMSPLNPDYLPRKKRVFQKITSFIETFKGIGGKLS